MVLSDLYQVQLGWPPSCRLDSILLPTPSFCAQSSKGQLAMAEAHWSKPVTWPKSRGRKYSLEAMGSCVEHSSSTLKNYGPIIQFTSSIWTSE